VKRLTPSRSISAGSTPPVRSTQPAPAKAGDHRGFVHTVLVDMRARLRSSERPNRIFEAVLEVAKEAGLVGRKRVLDSTALYDAVATQDTVTLIRSSIRALLGVAESDLESAIRTLARRHCSGQGSDKANPPGGSATGRPGQRLSASSAT
jgi:hypothetical protein